jgi:hypothetical protein
MKLLLAITFILLAASSGKAQLTAIDAKQRFSSINLVGVGSGQYGESVAVQTINGLSKGRWFGGVGIGLDYYVYRSVPIFADVRYELIPKANALFIYADAGINTPWLKDIQKNRSGWPTTYKSGLTYEGGLGLKLKGKNKRAFLLSCGYNFSQLKEIVRSVNWLGPDRTERKDYYDNRYRRVLLKVGIQL